MTDARVIRTRAALHEAAEKIAAGTAAIDITVSQLADAAGINRATFYKHFASPSEAVAAVIHHYLDPVRDRYIKATQAGDDSLESFRLCIQESIDYIDSHRSLFATSIANPHDGAVQRTLADHFIQTVSMYLEQRAQHDPPMPEIDIAAVARYVASGITGSILGWVLDGTTDRDPLVAALVAVVPAWWFSDRD
ncbi:MAG: TetR/AcrR family transcriptional regulator [Leucobacter sp.]